MTRTTRTTILTLLLAAAILTTTVVVAWVRGSAAGEAARPQHVLEIELTAPSDSIDNTP
jgi:hypothetical protein